MQRRELLLGAAAFAAALPPARAGTEDTAWTDAARGRSVPLLVRWPDGDGPCAAIVHSHGLGGNREGGDAWGRAWRDAGFAVLHVQHPGSDTDTLRRDGVMALRRAAGGEQLAARVADMRFVLDQIERLARDGAPWSRIRRDRIGASGHSFGAQTVLALAGKRYPGGRGAGAGEPRFRAFVAFSPSLGRSDPASPQQQLGAVARPLMALTGSADGDPLGSAMTGEDRARVYDGLPPGQRALLWLEHADHMTFGGNAEGPLAARRKRRERDAEVAAREPAQHALAARLTTLWWRAHLLGDASALAELRAPSGLGAGDRWRMD